MERRGGGGDGRREGAGGAGGTAGGWRLPRAAARDTAPLYQPRAVATTPPFRPSPQPTSKVPAARESQRMPCHTRGPRHAMAIITNATIRGQL
ncbi:unnamed protein product, partial [Iphiclides podalirius]